MSLGTMTGDAIGFKDGFSCLDLSLVVRQGVGQAGIFVPVVRVSKILKLVGFIILFDDQTRLD